MIEKNVISGVSVRQYDFQKLASALGAENEGEDLALKALKTAESYLQFPKDACDWIMGRKDFSLQDLSSGFSHGSRPVKAPTHEIFYREKKFDKERGTYFENLGSKFSFLVPISKAFSLAATYSIECDSDIRYHLYNGDYLHYFCQFDVTSRELLKILDFRTLDFFLPQINSEEWNSTWNREALFDQIASILGALKLLGRDEEAFFLSNEISKRKSAYLTIVKDILPKEEPNKTRLEAEKTWSNYLGQKTWEVLDRESRNDLVNAFTFEESIKAGYYRSWGYPLQSLLLICERELNISLFNVLCKYLNDCNDFHETNSRSKSRRITYDAIHRAQKQNKLLTLGELIFVLEFWNDKNMNACTDLFSLSRAYLDNICGDSSKHVKNIALSFKDSFYEGEMISWDLVKLRNSCAHPGYEEILSNGEIIEKLKNVLRLPPRLLIQTIVMDLRGIAISD